MILRLIQIRLASLSFQKFLAFCQHKNRLRIADPSLYLRIFKDDFLHLN